MRRHHCLQRLPIAAKIRNQHFYSASRHSLAESCDGACEDCRSTVSLVIAVHGSHHCVTQPHPLHSFGHSLRLVFLRWAERLSAWHRAESARSRADVAQNHECRRAMLPAFTHIRATSALAYRVQVECAHDPLEFLVIRPAEVLHAQPGRPRMD